VINEGKKRMPRHRRSSVSRSRRSCVGLLDQLKLGEGSLKSGSHVIDIERAAVVDNDHFILLAWVDLTCQRRQTRGQQFRPLVRRDYYRKRRVGRCRSVGGHDGIPRILGAISNWGTLVR